MGQLGNSDFQAPAITGADINDAEIIAGTQQELDEKGRVRFHYVMPDGSPLSSDWVMPDYVQKARFQWVDAVRQTIVAQAQQAQDATIAAARRQQMDERKLELPDSPPAASTPPTRVMAVDPIELAKQNLTIAREEESYWAGEEGKAVYKKTAAEAAVKQWTKVLEVLREG